MSQAIDAYLADLERDGCRPGHVTTTGYRLRSLLGDVAELELTALSPKRCQRLYDALAAGAAVDTHRNVLSQAKTWGRWCVERQWLRSSPLEPVKGRGRRRRGKPQLTRDEARTLAGACLASDSPEATAVLCCLLLGLRAGEVAAIRPRDLDDGGTVLRIPEAKTAAGVRAVAIPDVLRGRIAGLAGGPPRSRHWVGYHVRRWCELAGVTVVGPHGLRGTHASLATSAGASSELVAATLGHSSKAVTERHYTRQEALEGARQATALRVIAGGRR